LLLNIGFDDTDSLKGGCTTYLAALLVEELKKIGATFIDFPNLLRLNPNVPWKTRGNGAVCLRLEISEDLMYDVKKKTMQLIESFSDFDCDNTNPGIVFFKGKITKRLECFSNRVVGDVVDIEETLQTIDEIGASAIGYKNMRGLVGSLASIGGLKKGDYTFEFLSYRKSINWGTPRSIDKASVWQMNETLKLSTFNNLDQETGKILIAPNGPDPVLFGIRGEDPDTVRKAGLMIKSETPERWMIFRTNQGTDAHFSPKVSIEKLKQYKPATIEGIISSNARTIQGGHVFVEIMDNTGKVDCAAYEPTGSFRDIVRKLIPGDFLRVSGGVRKDMQWDKLTLNVEKLEILKLANKISFANPKCPKCNRNMESMGFNKGYRCRKCGFKGSKMKKTIIEANRILKTGLYLPPPRAQRHLLKPLIRYGKEKTKINSTNLIGKWHDP
jgi:tRNA(Ile2)-agmatinylcytidine synthase